MKASDAKQIALDAKDLLKVGNRIDVPSATNQPELSATASQQGTEVIRLNQDPTIYR